MKFAVLQDEKDGGHEGDKSGTDAETGDDGDQD